MVKCSEGQTASKAVGLRARHRYEGERTDQRIARGGVDDSDQIGHLYRSRPWRQIDASNYRGASNLPS